MCNLLGGTCLYNVHVCYNNVSLSHTQIRSDKCGQRGGKWNHQVISRVYGIKNIFLKDVHEERRYMFMKGHCSLTPEYEAYTELPLRKLEKEGKAFPSYVYIPSIRSPIFRLTSMACNTSPSSIPVRAVLQICLKFGTQRWSDSSCHIPSLLSISVH